MGTRSLTTFREEDGTEIVVMYRQFDGYPTGHGADLAAILRELTLTNGIPLGVKNVKFANGMGCLAAQVVMRCKQDVATPGREESIAGGIYLHPAGTRDCGEEYLYEVYPVNDVINVKITGYGAKHRRGDRIVRRRAAKVLFDGPVTEFDAEKVAAREE